MKYKVTSIGHGDYVVIGNGSIREYDGAGMFKEDVPYTDHIFFKGSIVECEAYIRLAEKGQI